MPIYPPTDYTDFEEGSATPLIKSGVAKETRGATTLLMVPPDQIHVAEGFNVRVTDTSDYRAGIEALANSIETEGFYRDKPLAGLVTKLDDGSNGITVTDGHRRMAAIALLREQGRQVPEAIPVLLKPAGTSMVDLTVALAKTGEPLAPLELATVCKRLQGLGVEDSEIVKRLSITPRYLESLYLLLSAPKKVLALVTAGKVSATLAIQQVREKGKSKAAEALTDAVAAAEKAGKTKATKKHVPEAAPAAAETAAEKPTLKIRLDYKRGADIDALTLGERILAMMGGNWVDFTERPNIMEVIRAARIEVKLTLKGPAEARPGASDSAPADEDEDL